MGAVEGSLGSEVVAQPPAWWGEPSFGQRLVAALVDGLGFLGLSILLVQVPLSPGSQRALLTATIALYLILATALRGQTLGKWLLGIKVVDVRTGELPGLGASVVRWAVPALPALVGWVDPVVATLVSWLSFLVFVPILRGPEHRGLHDRAAGTIVTRVVPDR